MIPFFSPKVVVNQSTDPYFTVVYNQNTVLTEGDNIIPLDIGAATPERRLIVLLGADNINVTEMKWESSSFAVNIQNGWSRNAAQGDLLVTTGTSGDLTITKAAGTGSLNVSIVVIVAHNVGTWVSWTGSASAASSGNIATSVNTGPAGAKGLVFATLTSEFQLNTTWNLPAGITEQLDRNVGNRRHSWAVYQSNGGIVTVRAHQNHTWNDKALLAVAFRKT